MSLRRLVHFLPTGLTEGHRDRRGGASTLARMCLVDDDGEPAAPLLVPDLVDDEGELLDRGYDDLLARLDEPSKVA